MDRYRIEPYRDNPTGFRPLTRYRLMDSQNTQDPVAAGMEDDMAQRIVALLNADEKSREKGTAK